MMAKVLLVMILTGAYLSMFVLGAFTEQPFICNIKTHVLCEVPYQSSMLQLYCPGGTTVVKWIHSLRNENTTICSDFRNRTCIVRGYEGRLSNDDSGVYSCIESEADIINVMVTILAPPQLTNIFNDPQYGLCQPEVQRNSCRASPVTYTEGYFHLTVTFGGVPPFTVRWFINNTEIHCPDSSSDPITNHCISNRTISGENSSTITIVPANDYSVYGDYKALVSNQYGTNESVILATNDCTFIPKHPVPYSQKNAEFTLTEGDHINLTEVCRLGVPLSAMHTVCYTNDVNATFADLNYTDCARCYDVDLDTTECSQQLANNLDFLVSSTRHSCPIETSINILSRFNTSLTMKDSGKIFCSFVDGIRGLTSYTTVHINVNKRTVPPPNLFVIGVSTAGGFVLLVLILLLVVIAVLGHKCRTRATPPPAAQPHRRASRQRRRREDTTLLVQEDGDSEHETHVSGHRRHNYRTFENVVNDRRDTGSITDAQPDWSGGDLPTRGEIDI